MPTTTHGRDATSATATTTSCRFLRPEIKKRQHDEHHDREYDRKADGKTIKLGTNDQFTMNDGANMIFNVKFMSAEYRQASEAAKSNKQINCDFRDDDSNFKVVIGDQWRDQPKTGDHHRGMRQKTGGLGVDRGEGTRGLGRHLLVALAQCRFVTRYLVRIPAARDQGEESAIERRGGMWHRHELRPPASVGKSGGRKP